ncbi:MAG: acetoacetate--CoA ligase [Desulfobacteraceae bacterium]|nr:acetoacetate--CoA ligase [Desulfobacteraceae bacterium]
MSKLLWQPSEQRIRQTRMYRFMTEVNKRYGVNIQTYPELYEWSVTQIPEFWAAVWDFVEVRASRQYEQVVDDLSKMPGAEWFTGARLNFAENLLRYRDEQTALIFKGENQDPVYLTYAGLYDRVARVAESLKEMGIGPGDRVVGYMPNMPDTIIAMLAAVSLGATWSSCSPDFGIKGVLDRFGQIEPRVLFAADGYFFKGKRVDSISRLEQIAKEIPSVERFVIVPYSQAEPDISGIRDSVMIEDFQSNQSGLEIDFAQLPANHPLYIMYSSGTTGLPKCMVQGAAGILVNQLKEMVLHTDVGREDTVFYFTTCGWMMWNWLTSALGTGATAVLYDGNPFYPDAGALWQMAQDEKITVFGTSAGYLGALKNTGMRPGENYDLSPLRALLSTGSPLDEEGFEYVYDAVKGDLQLASISGGTDLNGCFALGNPMGPVYSGELQCRGLGMKVEAYDENGQPVIGRQGELVCTAPFPSMPLYFWNDPDNSKYVSAYFDVYPGVWRHGDYIEISEHGGVKIYGRSDATLNPGGVRIGTAEIYRRVNEFEEIEDSLVVGQDWKGDVRVILFVKMTDGYKLTDDLRQQIKKTLRENASPRHVPAKILEVPDIPYTLNMKKVELAVKNIIENKPVTNRDALSNPDVLDSYAGLQEVYQD